VRVWDISPGYLNRQSLLGEHRELHGLHSILVHGKTGYSRHPETLRWVACRSGLVRRHAWLAAEMRLRGYVDRTPLARRPGGVRWPVSFVTPPAMQLALLASKYEQRDAGRIPLPHSVHELWAQHKYSVMARDPAVYREIGRTVARLRRGHSMQPLAEELVLILRARPSRARVVNALEHMWGHVSSAARADERRTAHQSVRTLHDTIALLAFRVGEPYLIASTALGDLAW
jgi:uncharacterized protein YbgA (DUF1722 family)